MDPALSLKLGSGGKAGESQPLPTPINFFHDLGLILGYHAKDTITLATSIMIEKQYR